MVKWLVHSRSYNSAVISPNHPPIALHGKEHTARGHGVPEILCNAQSYLFSAYSAVTAQQSSNFSDYAAICYEAKQGLP